MTGETRNKIEWYGSEVDHLCIENEYDKLKPLLIEMEVFEKKDEAAKIKYRLKEK